MRRYSNDAKTIVLNVLRELQSEIKTQISSTEQLLKKVALLTGVSKDTIRRWYKDEAKDQNQQSSENVRKSRHFRQFDTFDVDIISRAIYGFIERREVLTLHRLKRYLEDKHDLRVPKTTLWRIVRTQGK